jgi:hypothetical protein
MNRDFAKQALLRGEKVHLDAWASNEYVYMKGEEVYDENGTIIPHFMRALGEALPEFGWTIFVGKGNEEKPEKAKEAPKSEPIRFEDLLPALRENLIAARRRAWDVDTFIFAQVPAKVDKDSIQSMRSLPKVAKEVFEEMFEEEGEGELSYNHQIVVTHKGMISNYTPSGNDFWADDWLIISEGEVWSSYKRDIPKAS